MCLMIFFFFKQKTAYEMRISDWSSDVCSSDLYYVRKGVRYVFAVVTVIVLLIMWRAFAGRAGVVLGLATAGVAFAMQEVIGAIAGWSNIVSGDRKSVV